MTSKQSWSAARYVRHASFVPELGSPVLALLAPEPGERILDLGWGDGALTERLVAAGAAVVGVDAAPDMVTAARRRGLDAHVVDGAQLFFAGEFDAVFSNAALHWMRPPEAVIAGVRRALRPGGRFVGELGGHGNVASLVTAILAVVARRGIDGAALNPWYFPTAEEFREWLDEAGFAVDTLELISRPTALATGIGGWLETFAENFFRPLPAEDRPRAAQEVETLLRPSLCDRRGRWTADYVRLRFRARLRDAMQSLTPRAWPERCA